MLEDHPDRALYLPEICAARAMMRHELIPKADVVAGIRAVLVRVRASLLSLPTKAAPLIIGVTTLAEVVERLTELVHEGLDELANTRFVPEGFLWAPTALWSLHRSGPPRDYCGFSLPAHCFSRRKRPLPLPQAQSRHRLSARG
jgi:hypothetical protein